MRRNSLALSYIWNNSKKYLPKIVLLIILNIFVSLLFVFIAFFSGRLLDQAIADGSTILTNALILLIAIIVQFTISAISAFINIRVSTSLAVKLKDDFFLNIVHKKYSDINAYHSGELLNRFVTDVDAVVSFAVSILPELAYIFAVIIAGCVSLIFLNGWFVLIVVALLLIVPLVGRLAGKTFKKLYKDVQVSEGKTRSFFQENIANMIVLKSFNGETLVRYKLGEYLNKNRALRVKRGSFSIWVSIAISMLFTICYYGVLVYGAYGLSSGIMTYGVLITFLQLVSQMRTPLKNLSGIVPRYYTAIASAERLLDVINLDNESVNTNVEQQEQLINDFKTLKFENVTFSYSDENVLENCNFTINKGDVVAITAESGFGKTTLFKLLLGLYEATEGKISVNESINVDSTTRCLFSYVPQGNRIISGTIRDNLTLFSKDYTDEVIYNALETVLMKDDIDNLPDKLDTILKEGGEGLSDGQLQRLAIARALINNAPILLLDEATAELDEDTECKILENINKLSDKTVLLITHRSTAMAVCKHILRGQNKTFIMIK